MSAEVTERLAVKKMVPNMLRSRRATKNDSVKELARCTLWTMSRAYLTRTQQASLDEHMNKHTFCFFY